MSIDFLCTRSIYMCEPLLSRHRLSIVNRFKLFLKFAHASCRDRVIQNDFSGNFHFTELVIYFLLKLKSFSPV